MTTDPALSYHPTESLVLPTKRRFFPFRIPNYHQQLRHYISTADRDRIYVVVERVVFLLHISSQRREAIATIPFEPKCLAAGHGWIGVGGTNNGECAFVKLSDRNVRLASRDTPARQTADVDSALPIDLEAPQRLFPSRTSAGTGRASLDSGVTPLPEVQLHKFGGSIVNSLTIHRLPGDEKGFLDEDVAVLSNNDKTVTLYSLTRSKVLQKVEHRTCMNYAIISPDSSILAAVGDESSAYFYTLNRDLSTVASTVHGEKLSGWTLGLLSTVEMEIGRRIEDKCCFTIAFSHSNRLCAIGSQSGVIAVFDIMRLQDPAFVASGQSPIVSYFNSSRSCAGGGAVRCMSFSPEPWDLLVWLEDRGRAGIADVRQAFIRRQILELDTDKPAMEDIETVMILDDPTNIELDLGLRDSPDPRHDFAAHDLLGSAEGHTGERTESSSDTSPLRESLIQDLTERERLIVDFLNTARWTSRLEDDLNDRSVRGAANSHTHAGSRARHHGSTSGANRGPRPQSPRPVIVSQSNHEPGNRDPGFVGSTPDPQPSLTMSWTASPAEMQSTLDVPPLLADSSSSDQSGSSNDSGNSNRPRGTVHRPLSMANPGLPSTSSIPRPRNHQRSRSVHRRTERQDSGLDMPHSLRANIVTMERLRRQRRLLDEAETVTDAVTGQTYTQQPSYGFDHSRSPRWIRSVINDLPEHSFGFGRRDQDPSSSAGLGFGADGRTLYVATVMGIFEFQINTADRKTFPMIRCR